MKWVSLGRNPDVEQAVLLLEGLGDNLFSCLFQFLETTCIPWLMVPSFIFKASHSSVQFSPSVVSDSATPWTAAPQASLSFTISQSLLKLMSIESMMPSNHLISVTLFSPCPQSFPASRSFPMSPSLHQTKLSSNTSCAALNTLLKLCLAQFP